MTLLAAAPCPLTAQRNVSTGETDFVLADKGVVFSLSGEPWRVGCAEGLITVGPPPEATVQWAVPLSFRVQAVRPVLALQLPVFPKELPRRAAEQQPFIAGWSAWYHSANWLFLKAGEELQFVGAIDELKRFGTQLQIFSEELRRQRQEAERAKPRPTAPLYLFQPRRIGEVPEQDFALGDLFWSEGAFCVAQGKASAVVRCYEPKKQKWSKPGPRALRTVSPVKPWVKGGAGSAGLAFDGATLIDESGARWPLDSLGIDEAARSEPLVEASRRDEASRDQEIQSLGCQDCSVHGPACTDVGRCAELTNWFPKVANLSPEVLLPDAAFVVLVVPVERRLVSSTVRLHYALWLYRANLGTQLQVFLPASR